jgi:hypothetical protein
MTKNLYFVLTAIYFSFSLIIHFLRLMFEKTIFFGLIEVRGYISGSIIILSVFMVYWSIKMINFKKSNDEKDS